jgi:hypothetical protein
MVQLIEKGQGDVWTFSASVHCTSGIAVQFDVVAGEIKPIHTLGAAPLGVTLMPTRKTGEGTIGTNSVALDKIVYVDITGVATAPGAWVQVSGDGVRVLSNPSGTMWQSVLGKTIENIGANSRGLIKLIW